MFRHRQIVPEVMDQPGLAPDRHHAALRGLSRINLVSGTARVLWPALRNLARETAPSPARVLDLATGGGDVPLRLWRKAKQDGVPLVLSGCDVSPLAVAHAALASRKCGADLRFFVHDVLFDPLPAGYDAVICSLFLHHLNDDQAADVLRRMAAAAERLVLVSDLARGRAGWLLAWAGGRVLTRCDVVHTDAPRSVAAAFTPTEALVLAGRAGLAGASVERRWPCRWLLTWRRP